MHLVNPSEPKILQGVAEKTDVVGPVKTPSQFLYFIPVNVTLLKEYLMLPDGSMLHGHRGFTRTKNGLSVNIRKISANLWKCIVTIANPPTKSDFTGSYQFVIETILEDGRMITRNYSFELTEGADLKESVATSVSIDL